MLYDIAESTRRTQVEVQKLYEDEEKGRELHFYKDIAQRNVPITSASVQKPRTLIISSFPFLNPASASLNMQ